MSDTIRFPATLSSSTYDNSLFIFPDCYQENGKNYRGVVRKTRKGITCQKWNVNTPHQTRYGDTFMLLYKQSKVKANLLLQSKALISYD